MIVTLQPAPTWALALESEASLRVTLTTPAPLAVVLSAQGAPGPKGDKGEPGTAQASAVVAAEAIAAGLPLAISRASGQALRARADTYTRAFVAGVAAGSVATGFAVGVASGLVTLADWTAATGTSLLQPGGLYYLADTGGLSTTPPTTPGQCVVGVGTAVDHTTLNVRPTLPILL